MVPIPTSIARFARFIEIPSANGKADYIAVEEVVKQYSGQLFPNMTLLGTSTFRITRNADLDLSEAEADDLLKLIERELRKRRLGTIVRMEVASDMSLEVRGYLKKKTELQERDDL